jgi:drug/metabolite transporter (DMT)-like permease
MSEKSTSNPGTNIARMTWLFVGAALIFGSGMLQHWHQSPPAQWGNSSKMILDGAFTLGAFCVIGSIYWQILRKRRLGSAGECVEVECDERVRYIQGQAALFALAVIILVLGIFPMFAKHLTDISSESLSNAAMLIVLASWIGRLLWLNRD